MKSVWDTISLRRWQKGKKIAKAPPRIRLFWVLVMYSK